MKSIIIFSFFMLVEIVICGKQNRTVVDTCISLLGTAEALTEMMHDTHFVKGGHQKTEGSVWPQPQRQQTEDKFLVLSPLKFSFNATNETCNILESAFERYHELIFNPPRLTNVNNGKDSVDEVWLKHEKYAGVLETLQITLHNPCHEEWPSPDMDEKYELKINSEDLPGESHLSAQSVWGILRGLETFSQLIHVASDGTFLVNGTTVDDYPRFPYRGIMLDTSRHYLSKKIIFTTLETMAQNKFNVFHWHMVDNPSFPYQSESFPDLSKEGAYNPRTHIYSRQDVVDVLDFARFRGIRVIPEFDTPSHTQSWELGVSGLLTPCYKDVQGTLKPDGFGPIDPTKNSTFEFLEQFFREVTDVFRDPLIHLGGDEVVHDCWKSNPNIVKFMEEKNFGTDFNKLEEYYMNRLQEILDSFPKNSSYMVSEELVELGGQLKQDTLVQIWKIPFNESLSAITEKGHPVILSSCWYLNYIAFGTDWFAQYQCDPQSFDGSDSQKALVLGGEVCLWGDYIDATNLEPTLWPRACAPAERLWSDSSVNDARAAAQRLEEHRCRMLARGVNAQPENGPWFCPADVSI